MNNENDPKVPTAGLYRDPQSGAEIGCLDGNQAAAAIRVGYVLVPDGDPYKTQAEMEAPATVEAPVEQDQKKGKK